MPSAADHSTRDVVEFQQRFGQLHTAVYRQDVWAAAGLTGGCSGALSPFPEATI